MVKILIFLLLISFIKLKNSYNSIDLDENIEEEYEQIKPNSSNTFTIYYKNENTHFIADIEEDFSDLQINIYSIDCNIEIYPNEKIINKINNNVYSLLVNSSNKVFSIKPLKDIEDGNYKENYEVKSCFLSINSYYIANSSQQKLKIENKEENSLYYNSEIYNDTYHILYDIKNISDNSFFSLYFIKEAPFFIDIYYNKNENKKINLISKEVIDSNFIYLDSKILLNNNTYGNNIALSIDISNIQKNSTLFFKIIEENNICLLSKNKLNFGFITSKSIYQHYYTEVLAGEEGELMLHNKRLYGVLYAKIVNKNDIKNISNISEYPYSNETGLEYNQHNLQLKFKYNNTKHCTYGCYLLITFEQIISKEEIPLIGYEYTILSRFWNCTDYASKIIDIAYDEYYIGCFFQGSPPEHFYSLYIPDDVEKIIIQLEGNYLDAFYEKGRKKINTMDPFGNSSKLIMNENKYVSIMDIKDLNFTKVKIISFAIRTKDYFSKIISNYYFRVLYFKTDKVNYLPMDSNFGNLCLPKKNLNSEYYYCDLILKNDYNELNTKFAVSSTSHNEYVKIYITKIYKNNSKNVSEETKFFNYIYNETKNDIDHCLFKFEFTNNKTKNIISTFCDKIENLNPQTYSTQMFYLDNFIKKINFNLTNYYLKYQLIFGEEGLITYIMSYDKSPIILSQNLIGKPLLFPLNDTRDRYTFSTSSENIFYFQLIYNMKVKGIEEVKTEEPFTQFLKEIYFPLYYYLKIKNNAHINIDVNLRLRNNMDTELENKYEIKGYIVDEDTINRKINGEYITFENPLIGNYSKAFDMGFLHINQKINDTKNNLYLLIEIDNLKKKYLNSGLNSRMEISTKEYDEKMEYNLPINKYIIETFDDKNSSIRMENKYFIFYPENKSKEIFFEISSEYNDIELIFPNNSAININNDTGFKKYKAKCENNNDNKLHFKVTNNNKRNTTYVVKYSYFDMDTTKSFIIYDNYTINYNNTNNDTVNISVIFDNINVYNSSKEKGIYFIITGTLYKEIKTQDQLNHSKYVLNEKESPYKNKTIIYYRKTEKDVRNLEFIGIPRNNSHISNLQLHIDVIFLDNHLYEEFLVYMTKINFTGIGESKQDEEDNLWKWIVIPIVVLIFIILGVIFIIKLIRLKKKNIKLQQEMKTLVFSNDIQKNVLIKELQISKKESDFETTFI